MTEDLVSPLHGLSDVRVVDFSTDIAGPYATKLLADAGADVIKVEPPGGDPLRRWSATGAELGDGDGALFRFLHHGKRAVVADPDASNLSNNPASDRPSDADLAALVATADLVVDSAVPPLLDEAALRRADPALVVLSVTPFGRTGPYAGRPASEFTIQAESGALAVRGSPDRPPIMAGGRIGEWVTGTYAAVAATAAVYRAQRTGLGVHVDVSMLELLNLAGTTYTDLLWAMLGRPDVAQAGPPRTLETPSIEPTLDGWVGFTTNSRQQFDDFLVLIDRTDLLGDEQLARHAGRNQRFEEWNGIVRAWTTRHTTADIIERASTLRLPVAPVGNGATVQDFEQFVARGVFGDDPTGTFRVPRRPWRLNALDPPPPQPSPLLGEHTGRIEHHERRRPASTAATTRGTQPSPLPLDGIRVLDLSAWWAGPAAAHALATLGADVIHVEAPTRPDGMRMTAAVFHRLEQWWERSSIYLASNTNKRGVAIDLSAPAGLDVARRLIAVSDIVLENFTPRVLPNFGLDWPVIQDLNPRAILVRMPAFGLTGPWRDRTGFAQTMEQLTGLAWLTGYADDQPRIQRGPSDPNAGMHAAFAVLVALAEREATGQGQHLEVTMIEGALNSAAEQLVEYTAYGRLLERDGNRSPTSAPQGLYACRGREQWLALSVTTDAHWKALVAVLGAPTWATDPHLATFHGRRAAHDQIDQALHLWAGDRDLEETVETLVAAGIPAGRAVDPRLTAFHPQLAARRFCEEIDHPVIGRQPVPTVPFRFSDVEHWLRRPAPTFGQHNHEVLSGLLDLTPAEILALEAAGVIASVPVGL